MTHPSPPPRNLAKTSDTAVDPDTLRKPVSSCCSTALVDTALLILLLTVTCQSRDRSPSAPPRCAPSPPAQPWLHSLGECLQRRLTQHLWESGFLARTAKFAWSSSQHGLRPQGHLTEYALGVLCDRQHASMPALRLTQPCAVRMEAPLAAAMDRTCRLNDAPAADREQA